MMQTPNIWLVAMLFLVSTACREVPPVEEPPVEEPPVEEPPVEMCNSWAETLPGIYTFYDENDTSKMWVTFTAMPDGFTTDGLSGYGFWFPAAALSGHLEGCDVVIDEYFDVKHSGLPSPGGVPRYFYANMTGYGKYYPDQDSIVIHIHYWRTGAFALDYEGDIHFKKKY